jgi:hypothetical protein
MKIYKIARDNDHIYSKNEMIAMGADGSLPDAILISIPISEIVGRDPIPSSYVDEQGNEAQFTSGTQIKVPIEVEYDDGLFVLYGGNHRLRQAEVNKQTNIMAFVHCQDQENYIKLLMEYGS